MRKRGEVGGEEEEKKDGKIIYKVRYATCWDFYTYGPRMSPQPTIMSVAFVMKGWTTTC